MQRLNAGMMARYEIEDRRPARVNAVQFGMGEALLGAVDRRIDDFNAAVAPDARVGIACVQAGEDGFAKLLSEQDGLYTVLVRGYEGEEAVRREQVVQCVRAAVDPAAGPEVLGALAADAGIALGIADMASPEAVALAERFRELRRAAGLGEIDWLWVNGGAGAACPQGAARALADSLVFRSEADEAAKQCREMNYADGMIHIAEPLCRLTVCAGDGFRGRWPLDAAPGVTFADEAAFARERALRDSVFGAGLFLMAAPGWLNGCATLRDCMTSERLRRFAGEGMLREVLPALTEAGMDRAALEARAIESFGRYENPLNRAFVLAAARPLLGRFSGAALPIIRRWADENYEPPRRLAFALAATVMLYAGARRSPETGRWEVARGKAAEPLYDDPEALSVFAAFSHDMPPETLAYAALADRALWNGADLREIEGLEARAALDIAAMQRDPAFLPEE